MSLLARVIHQASSYNSPAEFREGNITAYRVAQLKGLLPKLFPIHTCALPPNFEELEDQRRATEKFRKCIAQAIAMLQEDVKTLPVTLPTYELNNYRRGLNRRVLNTLKGK